MDNITWINLQLHSSESSFDSNKSSIGSECDMVRLSLGDHLLEPNVVFITKEKPV